MAPSRSIPKRDVPQAVERAVLTAEQCHYCDDILLPRQVEHVRPLSRGGTNRRENLVAACISCNSQKRGMLVHEWRQWRETNGMSWPPVASHATDPVHYADVCHDCFMASDARVPHGWAVAPRALVVDPGSGYVGYYRCPRGHKWNCWWSTCNWYFSDCSCTWCGVQRLMEGIEATEFAQLYETVHEEPKCAA